jgi:hypothetical protein
VPFTVSTTITGPAPGDFFGCAGVAAAPVVPRPAGAAGFCVAGFCPVGAGLAVEPCPAHAPPAAIATTATTASAPCLIEASR